MTYFIVIVLVLFIIFYQIGKRKEKNKTINLNEKIDYKIQPPTQSKEEKYSKWELVQRKSDRWFELGFGDGDLFPGYGKIYKRRFKVWYCDVGSKEPKNTQEFNDTFPEQYSPKDYEKITGYKVNLERLQNSKEYERLFSGLDSKNRKRWYFALIEKSPTWIETESQ